MDKFDEHQGDIFNLNVDAYVNPVNCVGVMGAGLALQFKKKFPKVFRNYAEDCKNGKMELGRVQMYYPMHDYRQIICDNGNPLKVFCFPTKQHWKDKALIGSIKDGMDDLRWWVKDRKVKSIAIPRLGCGLGGLEWEIVKPIIKEALKKASESCHVILVSPMGVKWGVKF